MVKPADAPRACEALREVGAQIDNGAIEATAVQRAYIAGAADALEAVETERTTN